MMLEKLIGTAEPATTSGPRIAGGRHRAGRWLPKACTAAADCVAILLAAGLAMMLATAIRGQEFFAAHEHVLLTVFSLPLWILMFVRYGLYRTRHVTVPLEEFRRIVHAVAASILALAAVGFLLKLSVARSWLLLFFATAVAVVSGERRLVRAVFATLRRRGLLLRPVVIVGGNAEGIALTSVLVNNPALGYRVLGFVDDTAPIGSYLLDHKPVLGGVDEVVDVVRRCNAACALVATSAVDMEVTNRLARQLNQAGYYAELSLSLRGIAADRLAVRDLGLFQVASIAPVQRSGWRSMAKRALHVIGATIGLLFLAPVLALIGLAIRLDSNGPVLFRQQRVGRNGKPFQMLKFRTMVCNAEEFMADLRMRNEVNGPLFKLKDDPRVTRVGRILRRLSLDEVPQLWNVLRGEMSLVGLVRPCRTRSRDGRPSFTNASWSNPALPVCGR